MSKYLQAAALLSLSLSLTAYANMLSPTDRNTIQQQQRDILEQNQRQRQELQRSLSPELVAPKSLPAPAGACFMINTINL